MENVVHNALDIIGYSVDVGVADTTETGADVNGSQRGFNPKCGITPIPINELDEI